MAEATGVFQAGNHNRLALALQYVKGLFQATKRNLERMTERVADSEYYSIQHFISESPWDSRAALDKVARDTSALFCGCECVGLLIDESAHPKKGHHSVGVDRQYCGTTGKVDNCQVAVYAALSAERYYGLIDTALYLPKSWTGDKDRMNKAGVPPEHRHYKTKVELAVDIVRRQQHLGTRFDYVAADTLYGNSYAFQHELDALNIVFVAGVHCDQYVYTEPPVLAIPQKPPGAAGPAFKCYRTDDTPVKANALAAALSEGQWERICLRQTAGGGLYCRGYVQKVYLWDGVSPHPVERLLIIRVMDHAKGNPEYKYALSNAASGRYSTTQLVSMLSQRYFVERSFQDSKQEAGMSQYQVRGWRAWHHHMALVMMALYFVLSEKMLFKDTMPLLSAYDVREIMLHVYSQKGISQQEIMAQIHKRHEQRRIQQTKNDSS